MEKLWLLMVFLKIPQELTKISLNKNYMVMVEKQLPLYSKHTQNIFFNFTAVCFFNDVQV